MVTLNMIHDHCELFKGTVKIMFMLTLKKFIVTVKVDHCENETSHSHSENDFVKSFLY